MTDPNTPKKITKVSEILSNMNRGSSSDEVKVLQNYLKDYYPYVKPDGNFGPLTEKAVKQFQADNKLTVDGQVGPETLGKLKKLATTGDATGISGSANITPTSQAEEDALQAKLDKAAKAHPAFAGNDQASLDYAISSGDYSGLKDANGQPFSKQDQTDAFNKSQEALQPGFDIQKQKDTADTEAILAKDQLDYNKWQADQGTQFQTDKTALDQTAANQGVLFSGGRAQKEKALGNTYGANQDYKLSTMANSIGNTARNYQSAYGDQSAGNLSKYYSAGSNVYNPNVATGGVRSSGLSNLYNATGLGYQGTENVANKAASQTRAAGLLWNRGNKLMSTGLKNSYK